MIRKNLLTALCISLAAFEGCKKNNPTPDNGIDLNLTPVEQQRVIADNSFSFKLLKTVSASSTNGSNLMLSPLSVSFAVAMVNNGSNGQTFNAINNTMNYSGFTPEQVNSYYNKLITDLPKLDPASNVKIANSIWYNQSFSILPQFLNTNSGYYLAQVQGVDFGLSSTKDVMNNWVSDKTNGKIPSIITQTYSSDVMYLINAIYFKSTWDQAFIPASTHKQAFYLPNGGSAQIDFMSANVSYNTYCDNDVSIVELPYHNKKYSMVMVMPVNNSSVQNVISTLDSIKWQNWMAKLNSTHGGLIMPKFKFEYDISLKDALTTLGMGIAFSKKSDFTRINTTGNMLISGVRHKTYIEVNEDGTEAAAATSVGLSTAALPVSTTIDHPFIFAIREMKTGLILFTGIVNNPSVN
jgi:serine protease inhibitor